MEMNPENLNNECAICLDDEPSLELECGHIYHRKCIVECMRRKRECVLCRSMPLLDRFE